MLKGEFYGATLEAEQAVSEMLSLAVIGNEQDWEIEFADPGLVDPIIELAARSELGFDERCALCLLLIASLEAMEKVSRVPPESLAAAKKVIKARRDVCEAMAFYWLTLHRAEDETFVATLLCD